MPLGDAHLGLLQGSSPLVKEANAAVAALLCLPLPLKVVRSGLYSSTASRHFARARVDGWGLTINTLGSPPLVKEVRSRGICALPTTTGRDAAFCTLALTPQGCYTAVAREGLNDGNSGLPRDRGPITGGDLGQ